MRIIRILTYDGEKDAVLSLLTASRIPQAIHQSTHRQGVEVRELARIDVTPWTKLGPLETLRQDLYDAMSGDPVDSGKDTAISGYLNKVYLIEQELKGLRAFKQHVDEALNSGNGTYRP